MQARSYLPSLGRFTTADRFEDALGDFGLQSDPLTQERYAFGAGNPVNNVEFDGHGPGSEGGAQPIIQGKDGTTQRKRGEAPEETPSQTAARHDTFNGKSAAKAYTTDQANAAAKKAGGAAAANEPDAKPVPEAQCPAGACKDKVIYSPERQREIDAGQKAFWDGIKFVVGDDPIEIGSNFAGGPLGRIGGKVTSKVVGEFGDDAVRAGKKVLSGGDDAAHVVRKGRIPDEVPNNLPEQMVMDSAKAGHGREIIRDLGDKERLNALYGTGRWVKMENVGRGEQNVTVHWVRNLDTGMNAEFKFKQRYYGHMKPSGQAKSPTGTMKP
jgi:hypothetical protein